MYSVSFMFVPGDYDDEFYALDACIQQAAESTSGFIGKESWQSPQGDRHNSVYYWQNTAALEAFASHPKHLEAKRQYARWYKGYHVVVAKIERSYGDGNMAHPSAAPPASVTR